MINNKKVFLIYIICFFLFLTLILFPNYNSKTKLFTYFLKDKVESPFIFVGKEVRDLFLVLNLNFDYMNTIKKLEDENNYLSFLRQKESTEIPDFQAGDIAVVHLDDITLRLGIVSYDNNQPVLLTPDITNFENLRAVTND